MQHVLVIQLARFGDLVQTKRLLLSLAAGARVHLCLDASLAPLARLLYPWAVLHPLTAHGTGLAKAGTGAVLQAMLGENRKVFAELQDQDFAEVFNLNRSPLNLALAALFDPELVRGHAWKDGQALLGSWPELAMRWSARRRLGLNLVDFWAHFTPFPLPPGEVNPEAKARGGGLGLVLAGRESRRSLPPEILARLAVAFLEQTGQARLFLLGSAAEAPVAKAVLRALPPGIAKQTKDLAGKTDWAGLVDVLLGLDRVFTPDTGSMHLAAHLGVPVSAFFLSSAWCFETGPYGLGHTVYQAVTDCLPCLETRGCDQQVRCLDPFRNPGFVRFLLTGNPEHAPDGVLGLSSALDRLGAHYTAFSGQDADLPERQKFRDFLSRHLHLPGAAAEPPQPDLAARFYQDRDWLVENRQ